MSAEVPHDPAASMQPVITQHGRTSFDKICQYVRLVSRTLPNKAAEVIAETLLVTSNKAQDELNKKEAAKGSPQSVNDRLKHNTGSGSHLFEELSKDFLNHLFGTNLVLAPHSNTRGYDARDTQPLGMGKQLLVQAKNHSASLTPDIVSNAIIGTTLQTGLNLYAGEANFIVVARSFTGPTVEIVNRMTPNIMLWKCNDQDGWVFSPASNSAVDFMINHMGRGPAFKDVHLAKGMAIERHCLEERARLMEKQRHLSALEEVRNAFAHISSCGGAPESSGDSGRDAPSSAAAASDRGASDEEERRSPKRLRESPAEAVLPPPPLEAVVAAPPPALPLAPPPEAAAAPAAAAVADEPPRRTRAPTLGNRMWHGRALPMYVHQHPGVENNPNLNFSMDVTRPQWCNGGTKGKSFKVPVGSLKKVTLERWDEVEAGAAQMMFLRGKRASEEFKSFYEDLLQAHRAGLVATNPETAKEVVAILTTYMCKLVRTEFAASEERLKWLAAHPGREFPDTVTLVA